jgi:hypothetical protein
MINEIKLKIYNENPLSLYSKDIRANINKYGAVIFKNIYNQKQISKFLKNLFNVTYDLEDFPSKFSVAKPISFYKKINVGDFGEFGEFPRFFRTIYLPFWEKNLFFASTIFEPLIKIRNHIADVPSEYCIKPDFNIKLWPGCRVQQYFQGGGFFSEHKDIVIEKISDSIQINTIQLVALLTSKGKDFHSGGASIKNKNFELINIEDYAQAGDIIAYDASSLHGVLPIDLHKKLDMSFGSGRYSALASIYKMI